MDGVELLSGKELVSRGTTKLNGSLPTRGYKDVIPNGSWIEKKQVQCAIEARKHLIEVERIEKWGVLTHAEWDPIECVAKVNEMKGSHWSHMGHMKNKQMCLYPEETLYLMETNCLELKYGGVTVSVQQAYTLLLDTGISFDEYRVYSAMSRVGYKLLRHKKAETELEKNIDVANIASSSETQECESGSIDINVTSNDTDWRSLPLVLVGSIICENTKSTPAKLRSICNIESESNTIESNIENDFNGSISSDECEIVSEFSTSANMNGHHSLNDIETEVIVLDPATDYFDNISDINKDSIIEVSVPESRYLPPNIKVKSRSYLLNIENIITKKINAPSYSYSSSDEENFNQSRPMLKAITNGNNSPEGERNYRRRSTPNRRSTPSFAHHIGMRYGNIFPAYNFFQINIAGNLFFRPSLYFSYFGFQNHQRYFGFPTFNQFNRFPGPQYQAMRQPYDRYNNVERRNNTNQYTNFTETIDITKSSDNQKKIMKNLDEKENKHLEAIKTLVSKYKQISSELNNAEKVHIMNSIRNLIKSFNGRYNKSIVLNSYNEIEEFIISSSDSDCVEMDTTSTRKRKISEERRVYKRRCVNNSFSKDGAGCSTGGSTSFYRYKKPTNTKGPLPPPNMEEMKSIFQSWLPPKDHFGYPYYKLSHSDDFYNSRVFFKYLRDKRKEIKFKSWKNAKKSYERHIEENTVYISDEEQQYINEENGSEFRVSLVCNQAQPLIRPQDCKDVESVLNRLSIIRKNEHFRDRRDIFEVKFDVYRPCKAKNFKKTNLPRPAYRLVCLKESNKVRDMNCVHATQSQCSDDVPLLFAVIGRDSISYYQLGLIDLPTYIKQPEDFHV